MFSIRLLRADDATAFWILRQEALGSVPEAFGESVEERYRAATVRERKPRHIWGMQSVFSSAARRAEAGCGRSPNAAAVS